MTDHKRILFDACTLENFAVVARLGLLEKTYPNGAWTDGTELEIRRGSIERLHLRTLVGASWPGTPIAAEDPLALQQIDRIRRGLGGSPTTPTRHLGEAQIIRHISHVEPGTVFATDDRPAADFARRRGIRVVDTPDILRACFDAALLECPEAYELLREMVECGRGVAAPPSHWHICPS